MAISAMAVLAAKKEKKRPFTSERQEEFFKVWSVASNERDAWPK